MSTESEIKEDVPISAPNSIANSSDSNSILEVTPRSLPLAPPVLSLRERLDQAKKNGLALRKSFSDANISLVTDSANRLNEMILKGGELLSDDFDKLIATLDLGSRVCFANTMHMALPLLALRQRPVITNYEKPETPLKDELDPFPRQKLKGASFDTFDNVDGKCMLSGKDAEERIIVSIIYSLVACRPFLDYLSSLSEARDKALASKPLHKALVIVAKLVLFAKEAFVLDDTCIKRLILETKLPTDSLDSLIPHSYLVRIFTMLFHESTGNNLSNLKIYEGNIEEEKCKAFLQQFGTFANLFLTLFQTQTQCDDCYGEAFFYRTEPIFFCDSLNDDVVLPSTSDAINGKLVDRIPIPQWSCVSDDKCTSKKGEKKVSVVLSPPILVVSLNRSNENYPILNGQIRMDDDLSLYPLATKVDVNTIYDLVSVIPYQGETIITKYGAQWKEINGSNIKGFAFEENTSSGSCSLLFYVRREPIQDLKMEGEDGEEDVDDDEKEEEEEEEEEGGIDLDDDADETKGGDEIENDAEVEDEEGVDDEDEEEGNDEDEEEGNDEDEEEVDETFADDNEQEDEENESSVKDIKSLSTGHREGQIGKGSIAPIVAKTKAVEPITKRLPQLTRQDSKVIQPLDLSVLTNGKDLKRGFTSTGFTPTSLSPLDGVVGGPNRRDIIKKGRKGPQ